MKKLMLLVLALLVSHQNCFASEEAMARNAIGKYSHTIEQANYDFGIPASTGFFLAHIRVESTYKECAVSSSGAKGLMQLKMVALETVRATFPEFEFSDDLCDPENNIRTGVAYFAYLKFYYKGGYYFNSNEEVLMAYNRGPSGARRHGLQNAFSDPYVEKHNEAQRHIPAYPYPE